MFAVLLTASLLYSSRQTKVVLQLSVDDGLNTKKISLWENNDGNVYAFLPGYVQLHDVRFEVHTDSKITINSREVSQGMSCEDLQWNVLYDLEYSVFGEERQKKLTFKRSGDIPAMFIETASGCLEYIHENKENEESGSLALYTSDGKMEYTGKIESIKGRGNYTWDTSDKKPYSINLAQEANLLGLGAADSWILLSNAADQTLIRNKMVYDFAKTIGLTYTPDTQWVDLYLNGNYAGLYLLSERIEVHPQRVNIDPNNGYLVSQERVDRIDGAYVETEEKQTLRIRYPLQVDESYLSHMTEKWQTIENALIAEDGVDPGTGKSWETLIDLDSWVKKYLIEEIFANHDAGYTSQYFYSCGVGDTDVIFAGPVWDYDLSIGNENAWQLQEPKSYFANRISPEVGVQTPWLYNLYKKDLFLNRVKEVYETTCLPQLETLFETGILDYVFEIEDAATMNSIRWGLENVDVYAKADQLGDYLEQRTTFLKNMWMDGQTYYCVRAVQQWGGYYAYYAVAEGNTLPMLPTFDDTEDHFFVGWYYTQTEEPVDMERAITENLEIYAKWQERSSKKIGQILQLLPLGGIAILGIWLLAADIRKSRKT